MFALLRSLRPSEERVYAFSYIYALFQGRPQGILFRGLAEFESSRPQTVRREERRNPATENELSRRREQKRLSDGDGNQTRDSSRDTRGVWSGCAGVRGTTLLASRDRRAMEPERGQRSQDFRERTGCASAWKRSTATREEKLHNIANPRACSRTCSPKTE